VAAAAVAAGVAKPSARASRELRLLEPFGWDRRRAKHPANLDLLGVPRAGRQSVAAAAVIRSGGGGGGSSGSGSAAARATGQSTGNGGAAAGGQQTPSYSGGQWAGGTATAAAASAGGAAAHAATVMTPAGNTHRDEPEHGQQLPQPQIQPQQRNMAAHPVASAEMASLSDNVGFPTASTAITPMAVDAPRTGGGGGSEYGRQYSRAGTEDAAAAAAEEEDEEDVVVMRSGFGAAWRQRGSGSGSARRRRAVVLDGSEEQDVMELPLPPPLLPLPLLGTPQASPDVRPLVQPSANGRTEPSGPDKRSARSPALQDRKHPTHGSMGVGKTAPIEIDRREVDHGRISGATGEEMVLEQVNDGGGPSTTVRGVGERDIEPRTSRGGSRTPSLDLADGAVSELPPPQQRPQRPKPPQQKESQQQQGTEGAEQVLRNLRHEAASLRDVLLMLRARRPQPQQTTTAAATTATTTTVAPQQPNGTSVATESEGEGHRDQLIPAEAKEEVELQQRLLEVESRVRRAERALKQMKPWDWDELKDVHPPNVDKLAPAEAKRQRRMPKHYSPAKVYAEAQMLRTRATRGGSGGGAAAVAVAADGDGWELYDPAALSPVVQNQKLPEIGGRGGNVGNGTTDMGLRNSSGIKRSAHGLADGNNSLFQMRSPVKRQRQSAGGGDTSNKGSRGSIVSTSTSTSRSGGTAGSGITSSSDEDLPIGCIAATAANKDGGAGAVKPSAGAAAATSLVPYPLKPGGTSAAPQIRFCDEGTNQREPKTASPVTRQLPAKRKVLGLKSDPAVGRGLNPEDRNVDLAEDLAEDCVAHNGPSYPESVIAVSKAAAEAAEAAEAADLDMQRRLQMLMTVPAVEAATMVAATVITAADISSHWLPEITAGAAAVPVTAPAIGGSGATAGCDRVQPPPTEHSIQGSGAVADGCGCDKGEALAWRRLSAAPLMANQPPSAKLPAAQWFIPSSDTAAVVAAAAIHGQSTPDLFAEIRQMSAWTPSELMAAAALPGGNSYGSDGD
ncbi:hypothetical protein VaNZ11_013047, partial [Volvox africanus]